MNELGEFLRARRARVRPADVGLPAGTGLRRTPGLRREEVAALAGISIEYYVRLEQGRETNPSAAVLRTLSQALLLDRAARRHLYALANQLADRGPCPAPAETRVREGVLRILEAVRPSPACVLNGRNDILAANPEVLALLPGLEDWPPERRNIVRYAFLHPAARDLFVDWEYVTAGHAGHLRTQYATDPGDPGLSALVAELRAASPYFAELWERYDVAAYQSVRKTFHHPEVGDVTVTSEVLYLNDEGQRLSIYQAPVGSPDHDALALLSSLTSIR